MVVARREVWWAELDEPRESEPGFRRPVLIVQADAFNRSRLRTVIGVALSSNTRLLDAPGNVLLQAASTGLPGDSVANVAQLLTIDEDYLTDQAGQISRRLMRRVESGLRLVLGL
ncbi:MAG: type II toxin-antitoxin system PemK/MazF family toxin [Gemmatimonadetes bacterium]|nr:type II toxin-antitoxin system PemK/MazF family toxin [Gemmatimonadota bacterium]MYI06157.1 type II toxin-antitoxin system PemK/MazF family toxin [Gemmatimonadota bacterium]